VDVDGAQLVIVEVFNNCERGQWIIISATSNCKVIINRYYTV
jgi:hypothetical protein